MIKSHNCIKKYWYNWLIPLITFSFIIITNAQNGTLNKEKSVLFVYEGWEGHEPEKCRDVSNLFVTDGSFMTSSACQNPSLTYMAFTARACNYAVGEMKKGNL